MHQYIFHSHPRPSYHKGYLNSFYFRSLGREIWSAARADSVSSMHTSPSSPLISYGILLPPVWYFCFCSRYQILATSRQSLLPDWRLQRWSALFYHNIESSMLLCQNIFQRYHWMPFWTYQPHGQHWMYYPNRILPQHLTDSPPWIFFILYLSASSALTVVAT